MDKKICIFEGRAHIVFIDLATVRMEMAAMEGSEGKVEETAMRTLCGSCSDYAFQMASRATRNIAPVWKQSWLR